jgi:hemerythrin-like domain-containing protein
MSSSTRQLLTELRDDHRNMSRVLDVLEGAIDSARSGNDPDMVLIDEIMRYMTVYPDAVHHPKEDVVYAALKSSRPDLADGLDDVPADHREIAALGAQLRDDVDAIIAGAAVRRDRFIDDASQYASRLRNHMHWEEQDLFRRVDNMLAGESPAVDIAPFEHIRDPVFELEIEAAYARLADSLKSA